MDERLQFLINRQWTSPGLDRLMAAVSSLDLWWPLLAALVLATAWRGGRRARLFLVSLGILLALGEGLMDNPLKHAIHRLRPYQAMAGVRQVDLDRHAHPRFLALFRAPWVAISESPAQTGVRPEDGRSFPSSHVVNNVCAAMALTCFYRRRGWWYFGPAALVAYSRVYVGAHWPSDVAVSAVLAIGFSLVTLGLLQWAIAKTGIGAP